MKNYFREEWVEENYKILKGRYPNVDKNILKAKIDKIFEKNVDDKEAVLDNNYVMKSKRTSILEIYDFIKDVNPIIAGNGVLVKNHTQSINPAAVMLTKFLNKRKEFKSLLKIYHEDSYEYGTADRKQLNEKVNANSHYGCNGNKHSYFFNEYIAPAVTSTGQSLISTTCASYEQFLTNSVKFLNMNEFATYINNITSEKYKLDFTLPNISKDSLKKRLRTMFLNFKSEYNKMFNDTIDRLSQYDINRIYFKNNLYDFCLLEYPRELLYNIAETNIEFVDPNKIPDEIHPYLENLWKLLEEFVHYNYSPFQRISRLKYHKRRSVVVVDTDSNMLHLDPWVKFMREKVYSGGDENTQRFISINTMAYVLTEMITRTLAKYTKRSNVPKDKRAGINMKNEFLFSRIILAPAKKRYITSVRLREGKEIFPEKIDIKGHDFGKAGTRQATKDYFTKIIHEELLNGDIDLTKIYKYLEEFEVIVRTSLENGDKDFLIPKSIKEVAAYKEPFSEQGMRAVVAWNAAEKDMTISLPSKVDMVKVNMGTLESISELENTHPDIYRGLYKDIFNSGISAIRDKGVLVIAIPKTLEKIPNWIRPYIDYDTLINDNISRFYSVLNALGISLIRTKNSVQHFSNILTI